MNQGTVKRIVDWSLFVVTALYLLTGLGITQYRIIQPLTLGLLAKNLSFNLHENLLTPFVILFGIHISFGLVSRVYSRLTKRD